MESKKEKQQSHRQQPVHRDIHTHKQKKGFPATERLRCDSGNMKQQTTRRICVYLLSINQKTERRVGKGLQGGELVLKRDAST